jgi:hypothetical protein
MRCKRKKNALPKEIIMALPVGSTSREILIASDVARSWLAGEMARIIQLGCISTTNKTKQQFRNLSLHNLKKGAGKNAKELLLMKKRIILNRIYGKFT